MIYQLRLMWQYFFPPKWKRNIRNQLSQAKGMILISRITNDLDEKRDLLLKSDVILKNVYGRLFKT